MKKFLLILAAILIIGWAVSWFALQIASGLIHILLIIAVIAIIASFIKGIKSAKSSD